MGGPFGFSVPLFAVLLQNGVNVGVLLHVLTDCDSQEDNWSFCFSTQNLRYEQALDKLLLESSEAKHAAVCISIIRSFKIFNKTCSTFQQLFMVVVAWDCSLLTDSTKLAPSIFWGPFWL